ncbi:MAG TPA: hypothetical protein VNI54_10550 [Thermoanaerobaculia bacterium]|nr:hypothetical protein [Thermoanaerobaculia bacterium]
MSRRIIVAGSLVFVLFGCTRSEPVEPTSSAGSTSSEADAGSAAAKVVSELYREHAAGASPFFQTENRAKVDAYFEPVLAEMIWKDAVASQGEVGALGFDPLYNAQETDVKNFAIQPPAMEPNRASVVVAFDNFGQPERLTFILVPVGGQWRISDIAYGDGSTTLRGILDTAAKSG